MNTQRLNTIARISVLTGSILFLVILAGLYYCGYFTKPYDPTIVFLEPDAVELNVQFIADAKPPGRELLLPCRIISMHDADTYKVDVTFPWGTHCFDTVRCLGFDAFEVSRVRRTRLITDAELTKGKLALVATQNFLKDKVIWIAPEKPEGTRDPYGRLLGFIRVESDGSLLHLEDWMHEQGFCRE